MLHSKMYLFKFISFTIVSLWFGFTLALTSDSAGRNYAIQGSIKATRQNTCVADPSLAQTVYQAFRTDTFVHCLNYRQAFASSNSVNRMAKYGDQQPAFRGWPTQQSFTVPLFQLGAANHDQYIYRIGINANTPPSVSGFTTDVYLVAWVYNTQVCGSVPLYSVRLPSVGDRYSTINPFERDRLISINGWVDDGVIAYVLPL